MLSTTGFLLGLLVISASSVSEDTTQGRLLYENHCTICHQSIVHVRENRRVRSEGDLRYQINRWRTELRLNWDEAELDAVFQFLNQRYYQLEQRP